MSEVDPKSAITPGRLRDRSSRTSRSAVPFGVRAASEWAWRLGVIALVVIGACKVLAEFSEIVVSILIALLVSALLQPIVDRLADTLPRGISSLVVLLGALLLVLGLFTLVGQQTVAGFSELRTDSAAGIKEIQRWLSTGPLQLPRNTLSTALTKAEDALSNNTKSILSGALGVTTTATRVIEGFFITMFSTFFFLSSGSNIWAWLLRIFPGAARRPLDKAARSGWVTLGYYVRATFTVAVVDGLGVGIGAAVLGLPLALPIGVVVFLGAFIPVVGALITGLLAVLVALVAKGWVISLVMLGVVIVVNQLEAHVLQPFLLGRAVEVHPLGVILALAAGSAFAGILGALFAVPLVAVANTMVTVLASHGRHDPAERTHKDSAPLAPDKPEPSEE